MVVGHDWAVQLLQSGLRRGHLTQAYLFAGPPRIGKTTLALYLASALNCLHPTDRPCGQCDSCRKIAQGLHPDVRVVDEPGSSIKIDQIRELQRDVTLSPFEGRWRVHILCDFQQATTEAANCLLKTLEEPPPKVVIVLTALQAEMLLPTIVSRCQILNLRPLPTRVAQEALERHWGVEPRAALLLARLCEGRIGWAIEASASDALLRNREKYLVALEQILRQERPARMGLAQQLGQNPQGLPEIFDLWQGWWRDLLLAKCGNLDALINVDREAIMLNEAHNLTLAEIATCLRAIEHTALQVEQNVNPVLAMEVLLLRMPLFADDEAAPRLPSQTNKV